MKLNEKILGQAANNFFNGLDIKEAANSIGIEYGSDDFLQFSFFRSSLLSVMRIYDTVNYQPNSVEYAENFIKENIGQFEAAYEQALEFDKNHRNDNNEPIEFYNFVHYLLNISSDSEIHQFIDTNCTYGYPTDNKFNELLTHAANFISNNDSNLELDTFADDVDIYIGSNDYTYFGFFVSAIEQVVEVVKDIDLAQEFIINNKDKFLLAYDKALDIYNHQNNMDNMTQCAFQVFEKDNFGDFVKNSVEINDDVNKPNSKKKKLGYN